MFTRIWKSIVTLISSVIKNIKQEKRPRNEGEYITFWISRDVLERIEELRERDGSPDLATLFRRTLPTFKQITELLDEGYQIQAVKDGEIKDLDFFNDRP